MDAMPWWGWLAAAAAVVALMTLLIWLVQRWRRAGGITLERKGRR
jgi:hypothetical protein